MIRWLAVGFVASLLACGGGARKPPASAPAPADSSASATLRSLLVIPTDYGVLCGIFVLFAWQAGFVVAYSLLLAGTTLFLCAALPKWYREIRSF